MTLVARLAAKIARENLPWFDGEIETNRQPSEFGHPGITNAQKVSVRTVVERFDRGEIHYRPNTSLVHGVPARWDQKQIR